MTNKRDNKWAALGVLAAGLAMIVLDGMIGTPNERSGASPGDAQRAWPGPDGNHSFMVSGPIPATPFA